MPAVHLVIVAVVMQIGAVAAQQPPAVPPPNPTTQTPQQPGLRIGRRSARSSVRTTGTSTS